MPEPSATARLTVIIKSIELIQSEMIEVTLAAFEADKRKRWLVERGSEIISEASRRLPDEMRVRHPKILAKGGRHRQHIATRVRECGT